jgi:hypothetical protein
MISEAAARSVLLQFWHRSDDEDIEADDEWLVVADALEEAGFTADAEWLRWSHARDVRPDVELIDLKEPKGPFRFIGRNLRDVEHEIWLENEARKLEVFKLSPETGSDAQGDER